MSLRAKRLISTLWPRDDASPRRVVLLYHAVGSGPLATDAAAFQQQMAWIAAHAQPLSLDDLVSGKGTHPLQVAVTFDDGYESVFSRAAPVMRRHAVPGAVYVNTGWVEEDGRRRASDAAQGHYRDEAFMIWNEVIALAAQGWMIGSHGVEHLDLTTMPITRVHQELQQSRAAIEQRTGKGCAHFAYTWGRYDSRVVQALRASGYRYATSTMHAPLSSRDDPYLIPRIDIRPQYGIDDFAAIMQGRWDFLRWIQQGRRTIRLLRGAKAAA
jgi:peptidoglycan/xylan/chitin deacetylase (PgdA/CDA1 family)